MMGILTEASKKDILVNKLGLREDIAQGLYELCGPLSIWMLNKLIDYQNYIWKLNEKPEQPKIDIIKFFNEEKISRLLNVWRDYIVSIMDYIRVGLNGDITEIKDLPFSELYHKSEKWHESLEIKGGDINYVEKNPILIDFGDGYYWVDLQTNDSREECNRMGHCGRTSPGNRIFSLRRNVSLPSNKYTINKSVLTASINVDDGILYQLKGPKNSKPEEKYFKYILPLFELKNPDDDEYLIRYIGREYGHERDFKITDLPEKELLTLLQNRPDLISNENVELVNDFSEMRPEYLPIMYDANPEIFNPENDETLELWKKPEKYPKLIEKIYENHPEWFETVKLKYTLFKLGLIKEDPINWIAEVKLDPDDVEDYVDGGWTVGKRKTKYGGTRDYSLFEAILEGNTWDLYNSYDVDWKSSLEYYTDEENEKKIYDILTKMNPDTEFDSDMDLDELIEEYDYDYDIRRAISNATESCEADSYVTHLEKELKSALEEYGHVLSLDAEGVTIRVDLKVLYNNLYVEDYFWEYMDNCNYDSSCVFTELVRGGDVDKPRFGIDDRWYPDVDNEDFNQILSDNLAEYL